MKSIRRRVVSVKHVLGNSEYANTTEAQSFNHINKLIKQELTEMLCSYDLEDIRCVYRPCGAGVKYSAKSTNLWVKNMIMNGRTTRVGVAMNDGARIEFDVNVTNDNGGLGLVSDRDSLKFAKLSRGHKVDITAAILLAVTAVVLFFPVIK